MMRSDASLKGKIKALAKKSNLKPQELLQMYPFEHLLVRLGKGSYAEAFALKGGLLISSMTGTAQRTTMDMGHVGDRHGYGRRHSGRGRRRHLRRGRRRRHGISLERIEPIREGDEYANWRAHLRVRYGKDERSRED